VGNWLPIKILKENQSTSKCEMKSCYSVYGSKSNVYIKFILKGNRQNAAFHIDIVMEMLMLPAHIATFSHCSYKIDSVLSL
jgi:hypothetical protein